MAALTDSQLSEKYDLVKDYHQKYLKEKEVHMPNLKWRGRYTQKALTLICLSEGYPNTKAVSKSELTEFIKTYIPTASDDIQAGRHLGKQDGWFIITGTRGDSLIENIPYGSYKLISLKEAYPRFNPDRRGSSVDDAFWEKLKTEYGNRCACCGSKEGEAHRYNPTTLTTLQKGHKNPNLPLSPQNIIPQCEICNRPDLNNWEYNNEGRVIKIAKAEVVDSCSEELKQEIYKRLYKHFKGISPSEL